jgi:hypothetical protein
MKTTCFVLAALVICTPGCARSGPGGSHSSGSPSPARRAAYKVTRAYFSAGDPALILEYETAIPIDDMTALRREVDGNWEDFRPSVEKAGLKCGVIRAVHYEGGLFFRRGRGYGFAFDKGADGKWRPLPESKTPASGGATVDH